MAQVLCLSARSEDYDDLLSHGFHSSVDWKVLFIVSPSDSTSGEGMESLLFSVLTLFINETS